MRRDGRNRTHTVRVRMTGPCSRLSPTTPQQLLPVRTSCASRPSVRCLGTVRVRPPPRHRAACASVRCPGTVLVGDDRSAAPPPRPRARRSAESTVRVSPLPREASFCADCSAAPPPPMALLTLSPSSRGAAMRRQARLPRGPSIYSGVPVCVAVAAPTPPPPFPTPAGGVRGGFALWQA